MGIQKETAYDKMEFSNVRLLDKYLNATESLIAQETSIKNLNAYTILPRLPILNYGDNKSHLLVFDCVNNTSSHISLIQRLGLVDRRNINAIGLYRIVLPNIGTIDTFDYKNEFENINRRYLRLHKLPETRFNDTDRVLIDITPIVSKLFTKSVQVAFRLLNTLVQYIGLSSAKHKTLLILIDQFYVPEDLSELKSIRKTFGFYVFRNFEQVFDNFSNLLLISYDTQNGAVRTVTVFTEKSKTDINIEQARRYFWMRYRDLYGKWLQFIKSQEPQLFATNDINELLSTEDEEITIKPVTRAIRDITKMSDTDDTTSFAVNISEDLLDEHEKKVLEKLYQQKDWVQKHLIPKIEKTLFADIDTISQQKLTELVTKFAQVRISLARELYEKYGAEAVFFAALLDRGQTDKELSIITRQILYYKKTVTRDEFNTVLKQLAITKFKIEEYYKPELAKHYLTSFLGVLASNEHPVQDVNKRRAKEQELLPYLMAIAGTIQTKNGIYQVLSVEKVKEEADVSDIKYTYKSKYKLTILTPQNHKETIEVYMPELVDDQYYIIAGHRKVLMYQIINKPISITKRHLARITTNYQIIRVEYKPKSDRFVVYIAGIKQLPPLGIILAGRGIDYFEEVLGIKFKCSSSKRESEYPYTVELANQTYLHLKPTVSKYEPIVSSFVKDPNFRKVLQKLTCEDLKQPEKIQNAILETYRFRRGKEAEQYRIALQKALDFIDPVTRLMLLQDGIVPDPGIVLLEAALKAYKATEEPEHPLSLDQSRIRWSEMLVEVLFKELSRAIRNYEADINAGKKPGKDTSIAKYVNPETVIRKLVVDTANQYKLPMLLQHAEYSSPIEELSTTFAFKPTGPDGLKKEAIQPWHRDIHDTWYGIVSAVDTPENENIGIKNHLTITGSTDNTFGIYKLKDVKENEDGANILSPIEVLIPFIETNDGNRVMLASNQMRSITPIFKNEPPAIQTGYEGILPKLLSSLFVIHAKKPGKVLKVSKSYMLVQYEDGTKEFIDINPRVLKTGKGEFGITMKAKVNTGDTFKEGDILAESDYLHDGILALGKNVLVAFMHYPGLTYEDGIVVSETFAKKWFLTTRIETITIPLKTTYRVETIVRPGEDVKPGQVILAYKLPTLTDKETEALEQELEEEGIEIDTGEEISALFGFVAEVEKDSVVIRTRKGGVVDSVEIYTNIDLNRYKSAFEPLIPIYEKFNKQYNEYIEAYNSADEKTEPQYLIRTTKDGIFKYREKPYPVIVRIKIRTFREATPGDKLANRHGNKGVIAKVLPDHLMPKTEEGETIHVILDPLGIVNRMNLGQVYEAVLGYVSKQLYEVAQKKYKERKEEGIRDLYLDIYKTLYDGNEELQAEFVAKINRLSRAQLQQLWRFIQKYQFVPIIIPPFRAPSWKTKDVNPNMIKNNIEALAAKYSIKTKQKLFLPEYNRSTERPVQIGYMFIQKLEHVTEEVMHARSFGAISRVTKQAVRGRKKGGGFRIGEFDIFTLISHNVPKVLKELYFVNADDIESFMNMYAEIVKTGKAKLPEKLKQRPARELFEVFLYGQHVKLH